MSGRRSIWSRLYNGETNYDFVGRRRLWFAISGIVILIGLISLGTKGLNLGIDFEGGTSWEVPVSGVSVEQARTAVEGAGLQEPQVQTLSSGGQSRIRVQAEPDAGTDQRAVSQALADLAGTDVREVSVNEVGPSWGKEISDKAVRALVTFLVLVTIFIAVRFEWKMALATLAALLHDVLVTVGVYSLAGFLVTPATVVAVLTILGYSIYDGIVVFDKVDENQKNMGGSGRGTYSEMVNSSLNQVLMRTLNTSITALLPILSLLVVGSLVLGATTLEEFALALLVGLATGAYSSIFIASPLLAVLKEREPRNVALRGRTDSSRGPLVPSGSRRAAAATPPGATNAGDDGGGDAVPPTPTDAPRSPVTTKARPAAARRVPPAAGGVAPRPRKKGRRR